MPRLFIAAVLSVTMVLALSACGEDNTELIKALEAKTRECNTLLDEKQILSQELSDIMWEKDSMKYERDAFLDENLELRAEMKIIEEREKSLEATLGIIFSLTNAYREDLADIEEYISACPDLPSFAPEINDAHRNLMYLYFKDYMENIELNTLYLIDVEPILFILHVDIMEPGDLQRPARENCTYYNVTHYQSLVDYNRQDETVPIPRGMSDGLMTHWFMEIEDKETGPEVTEFKPNL